MNKSNLHNLFEGRVSFSAAERIDRALRVAGVDACVIPYTDPSSGPRGWFSSPNLGAPFDDQTAEATRDALRAAGLWTDDPEHPGPCPRTVLGRHINGEDA